MTLNDILMQVWSESAKSVKWKVNTKAFSEEYSTKDVADVDWVTLCDDVKQYGCYKFGFLLIRELLRNNLYHGAYADELYANLDFYNQLGSHKSSNFVEIMCGEDISRQIIYKLEREKASQWYAYAYMNTENKIIKQLVQRHVNEGRNRSRWFPRPIIEVFEESFGKYRNKIYSIADFTSKTLFTQAEFYKQHFANDPENRIGGLKAVVNFYRWLVREYPDHDFFANDFSMSEHLLFNQLLSELLERNFYFTTLNPNNIPYGKEKVCFLLRGLDNQSTRIVNDDHVSIDYSVLRSRFYRDLLIEFTTTSQTVSAVKWVGIPYYICDGMQALYSVKQSKDYPNPNLGYLTNQEAIFIRQYFDAQDVGLRTKNNKIGAVRRYLSYCVDKGAIKVDDLFFDYLIQYEEPNKNTAKTVDDAVLVALNKELAARGKDNLFYKEMFVIFHLALQTEFRINQICHLKVDCIKPTVKPNQFMVQTNSKTSHGLKNNYVISNLTYHLLMDIIEETEQIRNESCVDHLKDYIFVYNFSRSVSRPISS